MRVGNVMAAIRRVATEAGPATRLAFERLETKLLEAMRAEADSEAAAMREASSAGPATQAIVSAAKRAKKAVAKGRAS